jgi:hypothetical protein
MYFAQKDFWHLSINEKWTIHPKNVKKCGKLRGKCEKLKGLVEFYPLFHTSKPWKTPKIMSKFHVCQK